MWAMEGAGSWSRLPEDVSERVLSFLTAPALCRCRSVCRGWNELLGQARFLDLCEQNMRASKPYLFVTRYLSPVRHCAGWSAVDDAHRHMTCYLDLEERKWYSIPEDDVIPTPPNEEILRLLAIDDGLVLELSWLQESYKLAVYDPVADRRRELPALAPDGGRVVCRIGETDPHVDALPVFVTVVDKLSRSFRVFCMNRDSTGLYTGFFLYDSSTDAWKSLGTPPERLGLGDQYESGRVLEESAVFFQGNLYAVVWYNHSNTNVVLSYNLEENMWRVVLVVDAENPKCPQLLVFGDRMFIAFWNLPFSNSLHASSPVAFKIIEILVEGNSSRLVVQIPNRDLEKISGERMCDITYGFPLNSNCIVLISRRTGRLITIDLRSGDIGALPAHPLELSKRFAMDLEEQDVFPHYRARLSPLSLRNVL
ncbi:hypothetical protein KC19_4G097600 [Ceratodon purpureus]|uniref:F-box domain-containing protein n=1 Tax=Ceratodon purpureus TaxID=3225 RepID=A0A8T0IA94_CERPU|nr:hypothetical protein KC19_4G097600 [Ceratodon purpureus]